MELVSGSKFRALVTCHTACQSLSHYVELLHSKCAAHAGTPHWGLGKLESLGGCRAQESVAAPRAMVSRPVSVCKLPPIVSLLFQRFQFCVPSQLKIRFCLHSGQRPWGPPEKIRRGNRTQSGLAKARTSTAQLWEAGSMEREMALPLCFYV